MGFKNAIQCGLRCSTRSSLAASCDIGNPALTQPKVRQARAPINDLLSWWDPASTEPYFLSVLGFAPGAGPRGGGFKSETCFPPGSYPPRFSIGLFADVRSSPMIDLT